MGARRPLIGVLCCNEVADRAIQSVATRFIDPLSRWSGASTLLVPAVARAVDTADIAAILDGLLLTGSRSHVAPDRYGGPPDAAHLLDKDRDEVALALAGRMIERGKPVFGICRGLQELNVLFGGSLAAERNPGRHRRAGGPALAYEDLFEHRHDVELTESGRLAAATGAHRLTVNSVHEQVIERLGNGLAIEAVCAEDGVVEAISARPCGGDVLGVQWHPEWDVESNEASRAFFGIIGRAARAQRTAQGQDWRIDFPKARIRSAG